MSPDAQENDCRIRSTLDINDPEIYQIVSRFVEKLHGRLPKIAAEASQQDFPMVAASAHWLRGASATMGFTALAEPARKLESAAKDGNGDEVMTELLEMSARVVTPEAIGASTS